jgi:hypothetical protein
LCAWSSENGGTDTPFVGTLVGVSLIFRISAVSSVHQIEDPQLLASDQGAMRALYLRGVRFQVPSWRIFIAPCTQFKLIDGRVICGRIMYMPYPRRARPRIRVNVALVLPALVVNNYGMWMKSNDVGGRFEYWHRSLAQDD